MVSREGGNTAVAVMGVWICSMMINNAVEPIDYLLAVWVAVLAVAFGWQKEKNHG